MDTNEFDQREMSLNSDSDGSQAEEPSTLPDGAAASDAAALKEDLTRLRLQLERVAAFRGTPRSDAIDQVDEPQGQGEADHLSGPASRPADDSSSFGFTRTAVLSPPAS